ncbi:MAG: hypothetical protein HZA94_01695 [Candidatus Vogelbacteria bacterium]|nr:hypothetical protein [Candidatus Vogelbacteria bacterium]
MPKDPKKMTTDEIMKGSKNIARRSSDSWEKMQPRAEELGREHARRIRQMPKCPSCHCQGHHAYNCRY